MAPGRLTVWWGGVDGAAGRGWPSGGELDGSVGVHSRIGGHRFCWAAIGSPGHSCMASRLSVAGWLAAAGPPAKPSSRLAVVRVVNAAVRRFRPKRCTPPKEATQRIVPELNTPAPPRWV